MRVGNQWKFRRGKWSAVDYVWPDYGDGSADDLRDLGYTHVCSLSSVLDCEQALEAFVFEGRERRRRKRFGDAEFLVQLVVDCTVYHVWCPDFGDLVQALSIVEPLVRTSIRTETLVRFQELREELQRLQVEIDRCESGRDWTQEEAPARGDMGRWLATRLGAPQA